MLLFLHGLLAMVLAADGTEKTLHHFNSEEGGTPVDLTSFGGGPGPGIRGGVLRLLAKDGGEGQKNTAAFHATAQGGFGVIHARFKLRTGEGPEGGAFALLSTAHFGETGPGPEAEAWEEPNLRGSFAVGFDASNPLDRDYFKASGNFYNRPQREISLHWDGIEVANKMSEVEFRDSRFHDLSLEIRFKGGGAFVTVCMDEEDIYRDRFIPEMAPYESRVVFGARSGKEGGEFDIDDLEVRFSDPRPLPPEPVRVRALDGVVVDAKHPTRTAEVALPLPSLQVERIILILTLEEPEGGWDNWDRSAAVYAWDDEDTRFEILRYITPFRREYQWKADVTDFQSLLRGNRKLGVYTSTWQGGGFKVFVDLYYYPGTPEREAYRVENLWAGSPDYGDPKKPFGAFFDPRKVTVDREARGAKLRFMVTGHGQVGEFTPAVRTVLVNGEAFTSTLWKTDVYLNPVRPQAGTWKFDRAGWAPGDLVAPWEIDISRKIRPGQKVKIEYRPHPYEGGVRGEASHWVESQIVFFREPRKSPGDGPAPASKEK